MKLRTSFFNQTALNKNLTRFAPAWVLYTVFLLMFFGIMLDGSYLYFAETVGISLQALSVFNLFYALLCVELLMGDLFNTRICNALHAMPVRREGWFVVHTVSGVLFALIPYATVTLLALPVLRSLWYIAFLWFAGAMLQYLFFFALAMLSAQCVGQRFALAVVYGIINLLFLVIYWLVDTLYVPMLHGIVLDQEPFWLLCPIYTMAENEYIGVDWVNELGTIQNITVTLDEAWGYLGICTLLTAAFFAAAVLLYRKRALESAGDFVVVRPAVPVFLVLYTLCCGAGFHLFFSAFLGTDGWLFLIVGLTVGFFTGKMLLDRSVRVVKAKNILGFAVLMAAFGASLLLTWLDPVGLVTWKPDTGDVEYVTVNGANRTQSFRLSEMEDLENVLQIHQQGIEERFEYDGRRTATVHLQYRLKNGMRAVRKYQIDIGSEAGKLLRSYLSRPEQIFMEPVTDAEAFAQKVEIYVDGGSVIAHEDMVSLVEAILWTAPAARWCRNGHSIRWMM